MFLMDIRTGCLGQSYDMDHWLVHKPGSRYLGQQSHRITRFPSAYRTAGAILPHEHREVHKSSAG